LDQPTLEDSASLSRAQVEQVDLVGPNTSAAGPCGEAAVRGDGEQAEKL
jgi:hypothetical protein